MMYKIYFAWFFFRYFYFLSIFPNVKNFSISRFFYNIIKSPVKLNILFNNFIVIIKI